MLRPGQSNQSPPILDRAEAPRGLRSRIAQDHLHLPVLSSHSQNVNWSCAFVRHYRRFLTHMAGGLICHIGYADMVWLDSSATHPYEASMAVEDKELAGSPDQLGYSSTSSMEETRTYVP